jgi:ribosomal protein L40E
MSDLIAFIAFVANLAFFIWFGSTLNSINRHLSKVADHSERQTKLLASMANELAHQTKETNTVADLTQYECDKCGNDIPPGARACPKCGELT